ncbi:hypothetical protein [Actinoplanes xinjiangensis]|uniref:hypothetical protein n=1 Tax=Actinoplanes xinjiangensis TaxID=512350 RepID=UPI00343A2E9E
MLGVLDGVTGLEVLDGVAGFAETAAGRLVVCVSLPDLPLVAESAWGSFATTAWLPVDSRPFAFSCACTTVGWLLVLRA